MNREEILRHPAYWFENEQNEIYSQVCDYMEREGINQSELATRLKVGKSYVSQILKGNYNFSLKKWIELCLAIGIVPAGYKSIEEVIKEDAVERLTKLNKKGIVNAIIEKKADFFADLDIFSAKSNYPQITLTSSFGDGHLLKSLDEFKGSTMTPFNSYQEFIQEV
jgi:transcriptional regulator with XRE-family HTH domain